LRGVGWRAVRTEAHPADVVGGDERRSQKQPGGERGPCQWREEFERGKPDADDDRATQRRESEVVPTPWNVVRGRDIAIDVETVGHVGERNHTARTIERHDPRRIHLREVKLLERGVHPFSLRRGEFGYRNTVLPRGDLLGEVSERDRS